jgi:hypothetical protein
VSKGLAVFTLFHVALSVVGIVAGFVAVFGLISGKQSRNWTGTFLLTTAATSVAGFLFPFHKFFAFARPRDYFHSRSSADDTGVVRFPSCWYVASRLCHRRGQRALSERLGVDCAVFHEDSGAQGTGTYTVRTAISRNANRRDVDFHRAGGACNQAISGATGSCILSAALNSEEGKVHPS